MKVAIYLRKSRADVELELHGEGETLSRHERILLECAKKQKLHVEKIYKEIVSGETISARPVMQQLLAEVEQGMWEGILVVEIDRLARGNSIDQGIIAQAFKFSDTKIITPNKIYDPNVDTDEVFFEFSLFMSRQEYKTINRRLRQGIMASVKEGKYLAGKRPFGYDREKLTNEKGMSLKINNAESSVIKLIFDLYTKGENNKRYGFTSLAKRLNEMGIKTYSGISWTSNSIRAIITNPVYIGKIRWNRRRKTKKIIDGVIKIEHPTSAKEDILIFDGKHEAIITNETFDLAQNILKNNTPNPNPGELETKNPLAGLVECLLCGKKLSRIYHKGRRQSDTLICLTYACKTSAIYLSTLETAILNMLKEWLSEYSITVKNTDTTIPTKILENNITIIDTEIIDLQKQYDKTHELLEKEIYDTDTFLKRTSLISEKIKELTINKSNLQKQISDIITHNNAKNEIIPTISNILSLYNSIDSPTEKNKLLKQILAKVTYTKTKRGTKKNPLGDAQIVLFPKI